MIIVDHSLRNVGGHHFEYAVQVGHAAVQRGMQVVLATHRRFRVPPDAGPFSVRPLFSFRGYSKQTIFGSFDVPGTRAPETPGMFDALASRVRMSSFRRNLERLMRSTELRAGDHVFLPTVTELDLAALTQFLAEHAAETAPATWHLQFHYPIFSGNRETWSQSPVAEYAHELFRDALSVAGGHDLRFYAPTAHIAEHYDALNVGTFRELSYPGNPALEPVPEAEQSPLRVSLLGHARAEKGYGRLGELIRSIDSFAHGDARLVLQQRRNGQAPEIGLTAEVQNRSVSALPYPLSTEAYRQAVQRSSVGMLVYDRERYRARCSGLFVEYLCAGVPVIATAGTWMADQIEAEIQRHIASTVEGQATGGRSLEPGELDQGVSLDVPSGVAALAVGLRYADDGSGLRSLRVVQGEQTASTVIGRSGAGIRFGMLPLERGGRTIRLRLGRAFDEPAAAVSDLRLHWIAGRPGGVPCGAVGLLAESPGQTRRLLDEVLRHWPHYRQSAVGFAENWRARHSPATIIDTLLGAPVSEEIEPAREAMR
ncbi:hypothetical protein ABI59_20230 [Acidobacteria bacterium Mor1]|nr:hypothetical protein ABI59_20230 [Acidobacteria bacterium Mor1]